MASRSDTKTRILDAAEKLFAERGFSETSLRLITSKAEVNLASVNYHFGSKKELIRAVLARYLGYKTFTYCILSGFARGYFIGVSRSVIGFK